MSPLAGQDSGWGELPEESRPQHSVGGREMYFSFDLYNKAWGKQSEYYPYCIDEKIEVQGDGGICRCVASNGKDWNHIFDFKSHSFQD